ncbi:ribosome maturation factor RimM [Dolichospermum sp. ST_con]|nr:ribosome maturation factor RimM [Dolichospermum sp. ST_con]MDD1421725.1 ribosome maturation factor RimM [Dolichospermum sp. ST_sed1]MDD1425511.1 ribosome maturation factor RimM [Dolichospermum sp. ST_sed9]MDD1434225.1 ribosome maturation factor RimM [Dolichospermum sp. ST_sed6]MDD1443116.1 ribosome maturation factor RimM [Dolichospermum sp. ST_sed3]MDD1448163.1 ribosome maturation factor RimM [Dolichospermum sp. ST_sed8]MDD1457291.1 ribosome maturation factor RimM [Dolichospermum sp. ST_se
MNHEEAKNTKKRERKGKGDKEAGVKLQQSPVPVPVRSEKPRSQSIPNLDDWLEIGKIVSPQGLTGELRVYPNTDFPERFEEPGKRWLLRPGETELQSVELLNGRYIENKNLYVIKLQGVCDRFQAENMRDCRFFVPVSDRPKLAKGEFHVIDLLGLQVFMQSSGELVGTVVDILPSGHDLLEVQFDPAFVTNNEELTTDKAQKTVLIPFVMEIVPIVDLETRRVEITPPPGLLSVNN